MPINTSFLTVSILSFCGIRQAYCPYAFRFSEIYDKKLVLFLEVEEWKRERKRGREKREKKKAEKLAKLAKLAKLEQLEKKKESGRTASALSVLLPYKLFDVPVPVLVIIDILVYLKVVQLPPIQEILIFFYSCFYKYIHIKPSKVKAVCCFYVP